MKQIKSLNFRILFIQVFTMHCVLVKYTTVLSPINEFLNGPNTAIQRPSEPAATFPACNYLRYSTHLTL